MPYIVIVQTFLYVSSKNQAQDSWKFSDHTGDIDWDYLKHARTLGVHLMHLPISATIDLTKMFQEFTRAVNRNVTWELEQTKTVPRIRTLSLVLLRATGVRGSIWSLHSIIVRKICGKFSDFLWILSFIWFFFCRSRDAKPPTAFPITCLNIASLRGAQD